jgi:peptidoglycan/LPS O-acetylase OafA/YrhL
MEWFERWGIGLIAGLVVLGMVVYAIVTTKRDPESGMYRVDPRFFGFMSGYVQRRGGLTRREVLGWLFVLALVSAIVVGALLTGVARTF